MFRFNSPNNITIRKFSRISIPGSIIVRVCYIKFLPDAIIIGRFMYDEFIISLKTVKTLVK